MTEILYRLDDFERIKNESIADVSIDIQKTIRKLISELGLSPSSSLPIVSNTKSDHRKKDNHRKNNRDYPDDIMTWKTIGDFKTTVISDNSKTEVDEIFHSIRSHLNKMSIATYEKNRDIILENISLIETENERVKVSEIIFDVIGVNRLFTEIYADLYTNIIGKYAIFLDELTIYLNNFVNKMKNIQYVDITINYDEHCIYNKANDSRKVMITFMIFMMKRGVISSMNLIDIVIDIINIITEWIDFSGKTNEVDELIETIFLFLSHGVNEFSAIPEKWQMIVEKMTEYSKYKPKEKPSLNSRSIFKCIDLVKKYM